MHYKKAMSRVLILLIFGVFAGFTYFMADVMLNDSAEKLTIHYLDVGYGSSTLIEFPNGKNMLIDSGDETAGKSVTNYLANKGIRKIDTIVVSHSHPDHDGGLKGILSKFRVDKVITAPDIVRNGMEIPGYGDAKVSVVSAGNKGDLNDSSIVLKVAYKNKSFLFPSDIGKSVCDKLAKEYGKEINCDVVSVPHHGKSSTLEFVKAVSPKVAVVSTGESQWGGPDEGVLKIYEQLGAKVLRTDKSGTIIVMTDGLKLWY